MSWRWRRLVSAIVRPLSNTLERPEPSESLGKSRNETSFQKSRKEDWDNDRLASLTREGDMTSPPAAICRRLKDKKGMAEDMWEGKEGDVVYPDFSKAFDMVFCSLRIARLLTAGLKKWTMCLVESCLSNDGGTSSVVQSPCGTHLLVASIKDQPLTTTMEHYYLSV